jgi:hypothetical protein
MTSLSFGGADQAVTITGHLCDTLAGRVYVIAISLWLSMPCFGQVRIAPSIPPAVSAGACFQFTATDSGSWSVRCQGSNCQAGTISPNGLYCAPRFVVPKNQSRGCQLGPNDNVYNAPINNLPVHPYSSLWLKRISTENDAGPNSWIYHRFHVPTPGLLSQYDNVVDNSTPQQKRHFYYGGPWQDTAFRQPLPPKVEMQSGWSQDVNAGLDRHEFAINKQTCDDQEIYNDYVDFKTFSFVRGDPTVVRFSTNTIRALPDPLRVYVSGSTGTCKINGTYQAKVLSSSEIAIPFNSKSCTLKGAQISGVSVNCPACNSQSGGHWPQASNAILYGVDAAGSPISRTSIHVQEWWNAVQRNIIDPACNCVTLGHAIRTTLTNSDIAPADLWPSINGHFVTGGHPQIHPLALVHGGSLQFVVSTTNCDGKSFLQCMKPCDNWTFSVACKFGVVFGGGTGAWATLNGKHITATATGDASFTIPFGAAGFGAIPDSFYF